MSLRMVDAATKNLQGKSKQLIHEILTGSMSDKEITIMRSEIKVKEEPVPFVINHYDESTIQFPGHLKEQEDEAQAFSTLESLKKLKINRSLICAVKIMPEYLLYVKDMFSSKKPIMEKDVVRLNDRCTVVLQSQPPPKENDPGSFNLPCLIGNSKIRSALADLGASINVMPFSMFKQLQIGNLQPTNMMVEMADMTKKAPKGIIENVLVQIDKFIFPVDFVIIDMVEDPNVLLILGRPLLATANEHIDVFNRHISLGVGKEREETLEEELKLHTQSSFTKMKEQLCIVNTNEKSEPFIQQLNPLPGISQSSKSSIEMDKYLRTPDVSCCFPSHFISSEEIDTPVLGSHYKGMEFELYRMLLEEADLEHGLEHDVFSLYRANPWEYSYKVPTGSTQFLLVVRFSLPGLLESPGLMESIKRHSE
ncbi:transposon ty3-I gag-pol polyprotein [Tanacetum coccineum]